MWTLCSIVDKLVLRGFVPRSVLSRFTHFCVEKKLNQRLGMWRKMTNIRYEQNIEFYHQSKQRESSISSDSVLKIFGVKVSDSVFKKLKRFGYVCWIWYQYHISITGTLRIPSVKKFMGRCVFGDYFDQQDQFKQEHR